MAVPEQPHEFTGRGVELARRQQVHVALDGMAAHKRAQGEVGRGEGFAGTGREIRAAGSFAVVAGDAQAVQHRLDLAIEGEAAGRTVPGPDRLGGTLQGGQARAASGGGVLRFMAAGAGLQFARHDGDPASHELQRAALGVERLKGHRRVGRHLEIGRTVFGHRNRPEDTPHVPGAVEADPVELSAHAAVREGVGEDAQRLDRAARHAGKAGPLIHVHHFDARGLAGRDRGGNDRRARGRLPQDGFDKL